jgi:hypothetical protein
MSRNTWQFLIPLSIPTERNEVKVRAAPSAGCQRPPAADQPDIESARAGRRRGETTAGYRARRDR